MRLRKARFGGLLGVLSFAAAAAAESDDVDASAFRALQRSTLRTVSPALYAELSEAGRCELTARLCDALQHGTDTCARAARHAIRRLPMDCQWVAEQITRRSHSFARETIVLEALQCKMDKRSDVEVGEERAAETEAAAAPVAKGADAREVDSATHDNATLEKIEFLPAALFAMLASVVDGGRFVSADATYATPLALSTLRQIARKVTRVESHAEKGAGEAESEAESEAGNEAESASVVSLRAALVDSCDMGAVIGILHASRSAPQVRAPPLSASLLRCPCSFSFPPRVVMPRLTPPPPPPPPTRTRARAHAPTLTPSLPRPAADARDCSAAPRRACRSAA